MGKIILDSSVVSFILHKRVFGLKSVCMKKNDKLYTCYVVTGKEAKSFEISKEFLDKLKKIKYFIIREKGDSIEIELSKKYLDKIEKLEKEIVSECKKNKCYITPDTGLAIDGIVSPFMLKDQIKESPWNEELKNFLKEINGKVILDERIRPAFRDLPVKYDDLWYVWVTTLGSEFVETKPDIDIGKFLIVNGKEILIREDKQYVDRIEFAKEDVSKNPTLRHLIRVMNNLHRYGVEAKEVSKRIISKEKIKSYRGEGLVDWYLIMASYDPEVKIYTGDADLVSEINITIKPNDLRINYVKIL